MKLFLLYVKKFTLICVQHVNDRVLGKQGRGEGHGLEPLDVDRLFPCCAWGNKGWGILRRGRDVKGFRPSCYVRSPKQS